MFTPLDLYRLFNIGTVEHYDVLLIRSTMVTLFIHFPYTEEIIKNVDVHFHINRVLFFNFVSLLGHV